MNFNKNLYKREYYKYYNLKKKFLLTNANKESKLIHVQLQIPDQPGTSAKLENG